MAALAIVDDLGAVLVIAVFYTADLSMKALLAAAIVWGLLWACNLLGVRQLWVYGLLGGVLWLAVFKSGVHATVAGVLLALTIPARRELSGEAFLRQAQTLLDLFRQRPAAGRLLSEDQRDVVYFAGASLRACGSAANAYGTWAARSGGVWGHAAVCPGQCGRRFRGRQWP